MEGVQKVKIQSIDKEGITFTAEVQVKNPNAYKIHITSTDADIYLDGKKAGKANLLKNITVPANFDDLVEANIRTDFDGGSLQLLPVILGVALKKEVDLRAEGSLKARSFLIGRRFDFDYSHRATF